jgi:hypothetical protein
MNLTFRCSLPDAIRFDAFVHQENCSERSGELVLASGWRGLLMAQRHDSAVGVVAEQELAFHIVERKN